MQDELSEVTLILIGSTFVILMLTGLIIFSLFINQKRKFRHENEKSALKNTYDRELLRSQLEIQSQAFESISRELHDNVGTLISIAMVHIKSLAKTKDESDKQKISEADDLLNEAMDTLRDISKSIHPENITRLGWQKSLTVELDRIRKTNLFEIHYVEEGEPLLVELEKQVILFRILQETLNNIVKHSNGYTIYVNVAFKSDELLIAIKDDGRGFDYQPGQINGPGSGIKNMRARAAMLPATLDLETAPGRGTTVTIHYKELSAKQPAGL